MAVTIRRTDILIITVTKVESQAVMKVFQELTGAPPQPEKIDQRIYRNLGVVNGARIFMAQSEMGTSGLGASQQTVQKGILALNPLAVIMIGVAFGIDEDKQLIGDILVSKQISLYEPQRIGQKEIVPRGDKPHASTQLINLFRNADLDWKGAKVRFGLVLTGEKLIDNTDYLSQLIQKEPEAIGGEMEGAGLYTACQEERVHWILVKGICDWADGNKGIDKEYRQQLAASNASSFVLFALQHVPFIENKSLTEDVHSKQSATLKNLRDQFSTFLRKFESDWISEKDSKPTNIEDGKLIIKSSISRLQDFKSKTDGFDDVEFIQTLNNSLARMKTLLRHELYLDGGASFNAFWIEGDTILTELSKVLHLLDKAVEKSKS